MAMEELIALRLSKEELAQLDKLVLLLGEKNRSTCLRSLIALSAVSNDLAHWDKIVSLERWVPIEEKDPVAAAEFIAEEES